MITIVNEGNNSVWHKDMWIGRQTWKSYTFTPYFFTSKNLSSTMSSSSHIAFIYLSVTLHITASSQVLSNILSCLITAIASS